MKYSFYRSYIVTVIFNCFIKVCTQDVRDSAVFTMLEVYRHIIEEEPPQLLFPERLTRLVARGMFSQLYQLIRSIK